MNIMYSLSIPRDVAGIPNLTDDPLPVREEATCEVHDPYHGWVEYIDSVLAGNSCTLSLAVFRLVRSCDLM